MKVVIGLEKPPASVCFQMFNRWSILHSLAIPNRLRKLIVSVFVTSIVLVYVLKAFENKVIVENHYENNV